MTNNKNKLQKVYHALSSAYADSGLSLDVALAEKLLEDALVSGISFLELAAEYLQENNESVEESPEEDYQPSPRDEKLDTYHSTSEVPSFMDKLEEDLNTFFGTIKDFKGNE